MPVAMAGVSVTGNDVDVAGTMDEEAETGSEAGTVARADDEDDVELAACSGRSVGPVKLLLTFLSSGSVLIVTV